MSAKEHEPAPRTFVPKPTPKNASLNTSLESSLEFMNNVEQVLRKAQTIQEQVL